MTNAYYLIENEIESIFNKPLTQGSVDLLYKLYVIRANMDKPEVKASKPEEPKPEVAPAKSGGRYDRNINELLDEYIYARKNLDKEDVFIALENLLDEIADLVVDIYNTAICQEERDLIFDSISKMQRH